MCVFVYVWLNYTLLVLLIMTLSVFRTSTITAADVDIPVVCGCPVVFKLHPSIDHYVVTLWCSLVGDFGSITQLEPLTFEHPDSVVVGSGNLGTEC